MKIVYGLLAFFCFLLLCAEGSDSKILVVKIVAAIVMYVSCKLLVRRLTDEELDEEV